jgi:hypothetical protein
LTEVDVPVETLRLYVGTYHNASLKMDIVITEEGGKLYAEPTNQGKHRLRATGETIFDFLGEAQLAFVKDAEGVWNMVLFQGRPYDFKRVP